MIATEQGVQSDKRRYSRQVYRSAQILCYSAEFPKTSSPYNFATHLVDVSLGGACILSVGQLRPGVRMVVDVHFPQHHGGLKSTSRVQWSREIQYRGKTLYMTGLQFEHRPDFTGTAKNAVLGLPALPAGAPGTTPPKKSERRRASRVRVVATEVVCIPGGLLAGIGLGNNVARSLIDVSRNGAQISTTRSLRPNQTVRLRVRIPKFGDLLTAKARVRWSAPDPHASHSDRFFAGLSFQSVPKECESILRGLERWYQG